MQGEERKRFKQNTIALVYDFDGTLCPKPMQEYGVLPKIGIKPSDFWKEVKAESRKHEAEEILTYMRLMIDKADAAKEKIDRGDFKKLGSEIDLFPGVEDWFGRVNDYVRDISNGYRIKVEHYIVSAGLKEIIEGCKIAQKFKEIFASTYHYDHYGHAVWPNRVITDTSKTQYLFRINKGVLDLNKGINSHMPGYERPVPFGNIIYFGDGDTDVPSMTVTRQSGGHSIAVYKPNGPTKKCEELWVAGRVNAYCAADFSAGSDLDKTVRMILNYQVAGIVLDKKAFSIRSGIARKRKKNAAKS